MATIDYTVGGTTGHPSQVRKSYVRTFYVTGADAAASKGSALAASDVIQVTNIPAESVVTHAGVRITTADTGTTLTFDIGDGSTTAVSGADATSTGSSVGAMDTIYDAADTLDLTIASLTSANDDWEAEVFVVMADASALPKAQSAEASGT
jgi:hypothetical protein